MAALTSHQNTDTSFQSLYGSVENEECGVWKVRSADCGKCVVWKVRSEENFNFPFQFQFSILMSGEMRRNSVLTINKKTG